MTTYLFAVLALLTTLLISQTNAECCSPAFSVKHVCLNSPNERVLSIDARDSTQYWIRRSELDKYAEKCETAFCSNGSKTDTYCGIGECDLAGCNCAGGCIQDNGLNQFRVQKKFREAHGLTRKSKHNFK